MSKMVYFTQRMLRFVARIQRQVLLNQNFALLTFLCLAAFALDNLLIKQSPFIYANY